MKRKGSSAMGFYMMGVACLFLAVFFLTIVFGAKTYRDIVAGQTGNNQKRALLSYISTCVRSGDMEGAVTFSREDDRPVLIIADGHTGYGIHIYQDGENLVEDYGRLEDSLNPRMAHVIGRTEVFAVEEAAAGTYIVTTDEGKVFFRTRCGEGKKTTEADDR